jgi:hypothetical protein
LQHRRVTQSGKWTQTLLTKWLITNGITAAENVANELWNKLQFSLQFNYFVQGKLLNFKCAGSAEMKMTAE